MVFSCDGCSPEQQEITLDAGIGEGDFVAIRDRKTAPELSVAKVASAKRLIAKLEAAHRNGTLRPVNPNAQPLTMEIRVKAKSR